MLANLRPYKTFVHPADQSLSSYRTIAGANAYSNSYVQPKVLEAADDDFLPQTERSCADTQQQIQGSAPAKEEQTEYPNASQIVQYFHEEMPPNKERQAQKRQKKEAKEVKKDHLKNKIVEAASSWGNKANLSNELEPPQPVQRKGPKSKPLPTDNDFIRMCEENLSDITKRYLLNDPNPPIIYQHAAYRGALAADLKANSILEGDDRNLSLRMSNSLKQSIVSGQLKDGNQRPARWQHDKERHSHSYENDQQSRNGNGVHPLANMRNSSYLALSLSRSGSLLSTTSPAAAAQEHAAIGGEQKPFANKSFRQHQKQFQRNKMENMLR